MRYYYDTKKSDLRAQSHDKSPSEDLAQETRIRLIMIRFTLITCTGDGLVNLSFSFVK